jgi:hypothetical protein
MLSPEVGKTPAKRRIREAKEWIAFAGFQSREKQRVILMIFLVCCHWGKTLLRQFSATGNGFRFAVAH